MTQWHRISPPDVRLMNSNRNRNSSALLWKLHVPYRARRGNTCHFNCCYSQMNDISNILPCNMSPFPLQLCRNCCKSDSCNGGRLNGLLGLTDDACINLFSLLLIYRCSLVADCQRTAVERRKTTCHCHPGVECHSICLFVFVPHTSQRVIQWQLILTTRKHNQRNILAYVTEDSD